MAIAALDHLSINGLFPGVSVSSFPPSNGRSGFLFLVFPPVEEISRSYIRSNLS